MRLHHESRLPIILNKQSMEILTSTNVVVVAVAPDVLGGVSSIVDDV